MYFFKKINSLFSRPLFRANKLADIETFYKFHDLEYRWCIVGTVVNKHYYGQDKVVREGTKHFRPKTKVYCFPKFGGSGHENMMVLGIHRKSKKWTKIVIQSKLIKNYRLTKVFNPKTLEIIKKEPMYKDKLTRFDDYLKLKSFAEKLNLLTEEISS